ncbi:MAG: hypothetical protein ACFFAO_19275 [Candidatus Hermodarchaeota archaeon]
MVEQDNWIYNARKSLVESTLKEIDLSKTPNEVYLSVFCAIAKIGLHIKAKNLELLKSDMWQKKEDHPKLMEQLETFLWEQIK